ncbi:hypothetical protein PEDI_18550 [Persicobacter diffluens]|uniref:Uncharacterized protein n=1 Tax=Persicobacter diffluens TaxID=981 RepID=A0AAN5ALW7_9BACT|nr:hypothetical protein PEDI_18550 [Persicobacter diffluens]
MFRFRCGLNQIDKEEPAFWGETFSRHLLPDFEEKVGFLD